MKKPAKVKKLSKAEAIRFFVAVAGSGFGTWEVTPGQEYAVRHGQIVYTVQLIDNWPFGMQLQLTAFIGERQVIQKILFDRDTRRPWDERSDRAKIRESIGKAVDKPNDSDGGGELDG